VAASLIALEGGLPASTCDALYLGSRRIRGHALPETLVCHSGEVETGAWSFVRSVRIATHPALRRRGLASVLVDAVHESYAPDLFGTMFGATPELLRFRRSVGYELVRVGASRGVRTGEPAAIMLRASTARAEALLTRLRAVLARDLPVFLALTDAGDELPLDEALVDSLRRGLPTPAALSEREMLEIVESYASGPRTYETAASALEAFARRADLDVLPTDERALVEGRILERRGWTSVAERSGFETVPAAMRALRRTIASLLE
jgi:tRNA(Met) cytidine acetyltransferase